MALTDELAWFRAEVDGARCAQIEVEALDALTRYWLRLGRMVRREILLSSLSASAQRMIAAQAWA